jgi:pimeloyl-ACP methyl ester carboxylesterase
MRYGMAPAMRNWAYDNLGAAYIVTVKFFVNRTPHSIEELARIRCPVALVHCSADVAYPIKYTEAVQDLLYRAGIDARILTIEGAAHNGNVTHPDEYVSAGSHRFC